MNKSQRIVACMPFFQAGCEKVKRIYKTKAVKVHFLRGGPCFTRLVRSRCIGVGMVLCSDAHPVLR